MARGAASENSRAIFTISSSGISVSQAAHAGGVILDVFDQPVEAVTVIFDEFGIVAFFFDDHVQHAQDEGHVGPGTDREP